MVESSRDIVEAASAVLQLSNETFAVWEADADWHNPNLKKRRNSSYTFPGRLANKRSRRGDRLSDEAASQLLLCLMNEGSPKKRNKDTRGKAVNRPAKKSKGRRAPKKPRLTESKVKQGLQKQCVKLRELCEDLQHENERLQSRYSELLERQMIRKSLSVGIGQKPQVVPLHLDNKEEASALTPLLPHLVSPLGYLHGRLDATAILESAAGLNDQSEKIADVFQLLRQQVSTQRPFVSPNRWEIGRSGNYSLS